MEQKLLREKFNPDGSILRKHQLKMLEMLLYIDSICKKNNIKYWLSSGTLLGAVRHQGFIPWDDDLDIELLEFDYKKLIALLEKEDNNKYQLQTYKTDKYYTQSYAKLRDVNSVIYEKTLEDCLYAYRGVFIDIFPLQKNYNCYFKVCAPLHNRLLTRFTRKDSFKNKKCITIFKFILFDFLYPIFNTFGKQFYSGKYLSHALGIPYLKKRLRTDIFPLDSILFEGYKFPCPANNNNYLTKLYGNYMEIPDLDKVETHIIN